MPRMWVIAIFRYFNKQLFCQRFVKVLKSSHFRWQFAKSEVDDSWILKLFCVPERSESDYEPAYDGFDGWVCVPRSPYVCVCRVYRCVGCVLVRLGVCCTAITELNCCTKLRFIDAQSPSPPPPTTTQTPPECPRCFYLQFPFSTSLLPPPPHPAPLPPPFQPANLQNPGPDLQRAKSWQ